MNLIFCSKDLLQLIPNYDNSVFMVYFKLARVRHNVLMRQKIVANYAYIRYSHGSCVMGRLSDGSRGSWVTKYDPLSALAKSTVTNIDAYREEIQKSGMVNCIKCDRQIKMTRDTTT